MARAARRKRPFAENTIAEVCCLRGHLYSVASQGAWSNPFCNLAECSYHSSTAERRQRPGPTLGDDSDTVDLAKSSSSRPYCCLPTAEVQSDTSTQYPDSRVTRQWLWPLTMKRLTPPPKRARIYPRRPRSQEVARCFRSLSSHYITSMSAHLKSTFAAKAETVSLLHYSTRGSLADASAAFVDSLRSSCRTRPHL